MSLPEDTARSGVRAPVLLATDGGAERGTLIDRLRHLARERGNATALTFLGDGESESERLTYGELDREARRLGALLAERARPGDRVLLLFPPGLDFAAAFLGCLYGGAVAVPAYPPRSRNLARLLSIARDARPRWVLSTAALRQRLAGLFAAEPDLCELAWLACEEADAGLARRWRDPEATPESLAFLQYTSGSTAEPKGVMVSHGNILHNERAIHEAFGQSEESVVVGWLPLYHDMGLIGTVLQPLYCGARSILMSPAAFLQQPLRWLQAVSRYRATTSGGPNFGYELCLEKIRPGERAGLDLSAWEIAFSGAEPVRADTLERFAAAFAPCGFRRAAFYPCYGLAEATLFATGGAPGAPPVVARFDAAGLEEGSARPSPSGRELVSCGRPWHGQRVLVVDPATLAPCPTERVGEIWVAGPGVALGYWGAPRESAATFAAAPADALDDAAYLRTGDLGFLHAGELYVTGRLKDLILLRGRNLYPQDLEWTAGRSHPALRPEGGAAFVAGAAGGEAEGRLVLVQEIERRREAEAADALAALQRAVADEHEVLPAEVVVVRAGAVPKTSSGKVRRRACRDAYLAGALEVVARRTAEGEGASTDLGAARAALLALPGADRPAAVEALVAGKLAGRLGLPEGRIERTAPLVELGLDSLAAMELAGDLAALGGEASPGVAELLSGASLADVASALLAALAAPAAHPAAPAAPDASREEGRELPLSFGQRALWFLHRLAPASAAYNIAAAARLESADLGADPAALYDAFAALVARHPALRTTFGERDGVPFQRVQPGMGIDFLAVDAAGWDEAARLRYLAGEALRPFDLERGPLLRLRLLAAGDGDARVLLAVHHIAADLWSMGILLRELGAIYAPDRPGAERALAAPDLAYGDHVRREIERLAGEAGERDWVFWRGQLAGAPPASELPADRPRPALQTYVGGARSRRLAAGLRADLAALGRHHGATLHMLLLAALRALLLRTTGEEDAVVGSPVAGRGPGLWDVVGYFVNPLPLRLRAVAEESFGDLVASVRRSVLLAFAHQDYPFPLLVERLGGARDPGRSPLFQLMLVVEKGAGRDGAALGAFALGEPGAVLAAGPLRLAALPLPRRTAQLDLSLLAAELDGGLALCAEHNLDLFDGTTAERLLGHLEALLAGAAERPEAPLAALSPLTAPERHQALVEWNDAACGPRPEALDRRLHELIAAQAARTPAAEALVAGAERWTYAELEARAERVARRLRRLGVGPEARVAVCAERSAALVAGLLGILKAGGAYLPIDPAYPDERIAFTLADARAALVLVSPAQEGRLAAFGRTLRLDGGEADGEAAPAAGEPAPAASGGGGDLAYLIYTSGSTGRPKGVAIEHRSAVALALWARRLWDDDELSGVLASTSICFDLSVFELWVPLCWGGRVILAADALELPSLAAAGEVRLVNTVPSVLAELLRGGGLPASVRTVNLAGEPLRSGLVEAVWRRSRGARVLNLYGPSEDTTYSTWAVMEAGPEEPSIGRPIHGTSLYLLDGAGEPVPLGAPGEIHLGGAGLARGYHGRPELTAERFVPDGLGGRPGGRLYRTGDLGRRRHDGAVEYLGRLDHQVKVRGFRIEPGEVEAALGDHPAVREAAVLVEPEAGGGSHLVACVVAEGAAPVSPVSVSDAELREHLRRRLPPYLLPAAFVRTGALPRTVSGKVDRRALAARLERERAARREGATAGAPELAAGSAAGTPFEELLAGIWTSVLERAPIGRDDDFFLLGGHSLLATQVVSRVREAFGVELPLADLFQRPTLAAQAAWIAERMEAPSGGPASAVETIGRAPREGDLPLSFAQERLWFLDRLQPGGIAYNIPLAVRLKGALSAAALEASLAEVVRRHEVLRTAIEVRGGRPVQRIAPPDAPGLSLPTVDLSAPELAGGAWREALHLAREEARRPFDLARSVARAGLLRLGAAEHLLLLTLHHVAADGWSLGVLMDEVRELYAARVSRPGRPAAGTLPELPIQYADFALWQRRWLAGGELARQLGYWRRQLDGAPAFLDLPADRVRPTVQSFRGRSLRRPLAAALAADIDRLARERAATPFMVLLAAFAALLRRLTHQDDQVIGTPIANRNRLEIERLIGFFVNTLALRQDLSGDPAFDELLGRVRRTALAAYAHQDLPFELLVEELRPARHLSHNPLFQVMFAVQNAPFGGLALQGLELARLELPVETSKFDLGLTMSAGAEGLAATLDYATDLFDATTAERLAGHLLALLAGALAEPRRAISELPLLGVAERHQLLVEWSATEPAGEPEGVVDLFAAQAARMPEAEAIAYAPETEAKGSASDAAPVERLTYGELDRRSTDLARTLIDLGVGPGVPVGLFAERSPAMAVGLLGILKAGGAFLPLDPSLPPARLAFLIADSGLTFLATTGSLLASLPPAAAACAIARIDGPAAGGAGAAVKPARPDDPAYMIYTSGTTGEPKAVLVSHRSLAHTLAATRRAFGFERRDRIACLAPFSFDIFLFELLSPLLAGGSARLFPLRPTLDLERLVAALADPAERITLLHAVPALMQQIVAAARRTASGGRVGSALRAVFVGGDTVPSELLADLRAAFPTARVHVLYGPTEAAIVASFHTVPAAGAVRSSLGRPFAGVHLELRDGAGRLVPIGVPGEIWLGGPGIALGYWRRPELTAERFVPASAAGRRLRTGDLARRLPDGTVEFLGRLDTQVKVRGFRIELGEVESVLARHPEVQQAVVAARAGEGAQAPAGRQLVAYVVRRLGTATAEAVAEQLDHVAAWQTIYDQTYASSAEADPTLDLQGWNSSYTGLPIPRPEMEEWVAATVVRLRRLNARRVLEVGCGTGLLLFRLAPEAERYRATDFSPAALAAVERGLKAAPLPQVLLERRLADDWRGIAAGEADLVVLNSIVQYFPDGDYLVQVLKEAVRAVAPGGKVFVGDVRSLPLLAAFHLSTTLAGAPDGTTVAELRRRVRRRAAAEKELVVAPAFFRALQLRLPAIRRVDLLLKRGACQNELTRFRYDVVLHVGEAAVAEDEPAAGAAPRPIEWQERFGGPRPLADLERFLAADAPEAVALAGIPNGRLAGEAAALDLLAGALDVETAGDLRRALAGRPEAGAGVDPEALASLGERLGYEVELKLPAAGSGLRFAAVLRRPGAGCPVAADGEAAPALAWQAYLNDPLRHKLARRLIPELRRFLKAELPEYMLPAAYQLLDALPLSAHGKVDLAALPPPDSSRPELAASYVEPRTPLERALAELWAELLGVERVGVHDDFFELGGHSLLAVQVVSRLRDLLHVEIPLRGLFEEPTVAGLAGLVERARGGLAPHALPIERAARDGEPPLSFAQERLWFLDQLAPGSPAYNMPAILRLGGRLSVAALERSLAEVVRRHEALRTSFPAREGGPVQRIAPAPSAPSILARIDLTALAAPRGERAARDLVEAEVQRPFDLARGPLFRVALLTWAAGDHLLAVTLHHAVSDGWSVGVLVRELTALYAASLAGRPSPLDDLPLQYADFAVWQRGWLAGEALEGELAYWRERLAGPPAPLDLPADRPRPAVKGSRGARRPFRAPLAAVEELGHAHRATIFMALLAVFQVLLGRLSGREDLVVGTPVAGRSRSELEGLIGFFVNTLALRGDLAGDPPFAELLARVREEVIGAFAHQDLPFERLVEELRPERSLAYTPLVQAMFALQTAPAGELAAPGLQIEMLEPAFCASKFDLSLTLTPHEGFLAGALEHDADLFDGVTAERWLEHFGNLLAGAAAAPSTRLAELPLLSAAARHQLAVEWNDTDLDAAERPADEAIAERARRAPDAVALVHGDAALTYAALDRRAERLAARLRRAGAGPERLAGVCLDRSPDMVVALLAVWKSGAALLPLDPGAPPERLALVLADAAVSLVVAEPGWEAAGAGVQTIDPRAGEEMPAARGAARRGALAYAIYTSGTTGPPKAVLVEHASLASLLEAGCARLGLGPRDRMLAMAPFSFDIALFELLVPLASGACIVLLDRGEVLDVGGLLAGWRQATCLHAVPSLMRQVVEQLQEKTAEPAPPPRVVLVGGELVEPELLRAMRGAFPAARIEVLYGPTEGTILSAAHPVPARPAIAGRPLLGTPLPNTRLDLVGPQGEPVPIGVVGEVAIAGAGVSRGYLGRPALTAERYLPVAGGGRAYRTGDLARRRPDGVLEFVGRNDRQVKIRGYRVELGEVEAALLDQPEIRAAAVLAVPAGEGRRLVAFAVAEPASEPPAGGELRRRLERRLPDYMLPAAVSFLPALPLTAHGKVDRRALAALAPGLAAEGGAESAPRTPYEELVAEVWAELLGRERVGVDDDFFALGGHSLLATRAASRLRQTFGVELPLRTLFESPTVARLARSIEEARRAGSTAPAPPIEPLPRGGPLAPSFAQERLWLLDQMAPESTLYAIPVTLDLAGELRVAALAWSLGEVVRRHEALRTRFAAVDGRPVQVIDAPPPASLPVIDLGGLAAPAAEGEARRLAALRARRPFDLARGPLFRASLLRLGGRRWWLGLDLHHIISDGWSMGVLVREITALYGPRAAAAVPAVPAPLPDLRVQPADHAAWQRRWLGGDVLAGEIAYWRERLAGAPPLLELPLDRPRPARRAERGGVWSFTLGREPAAALAALGRRQGATLFMTLLAVFEALLGHWTGQADLSVGTPVAGRTRAETEGLIGFFVNTLVLRVEIAADATFAALLAAVREAALAAYTHQELPFEKLVEELAPERSLAHTPLFQAMFAVQEDASEELALPGLALRRLDLGSEAAKFDWTLTFVTRRDGCLAGALSYDASLFDRSTAARLAGHFERLAESATDDPEAAAARLDGLPWLTAAERHQLAAEWSDSATVVPRLAVHELFAARAALHPERPAVEFGVETATYGELEERANRLAGRLRGRGARPEERVGLCVERSVAMVVGMLGILKAGAAYVPLDPAYPRERLAAMMEDAGVSILVTEPALAAELPEVAARLLLGPEEEDEEDALGPAEPPPVRVAPDALAYVTYTSGSTGRPKGIAVSHLAVVRLVRETDYVDLGPDDRVAQASSSTFDAATFEVWGALLCGGVLVGIPREVTLAPARFAASLREGRVSALFLTTALFNQMARETPWAFGSLRYVLFGGEAVEPRWVEAVLAEGRPGRLLHVYGPTEATTFSTWHAVDAVEAGARTIPIGRPLANASAHVLDRELRPVPVGVAGELLLGGDGLARGYEGRPELTAESFVPDGCGAEPGRRLYRTGDVVRRDAAGRIEFLGRRDQQVKVRGFRIELSEIETVLAEHPAVAQAVLVARRREGEGWSDRRLVAYVTRAAGEAGALAPERELAAELRRYVGTRLPAYMVPAQMVVAAELPMTATGKLDRRALASRPPELAGGEEAGGSLPRTPYEEMVAQVWAELLGRERVAVDDDFFALGGHSLLATQAAARLRQAFGVDLPLRALFENPTVARLAPVIEEARWAGRPAPPPLAASPRVGALPLPLSFAQERLWFNELLNPGSALYAVPVTLELVGELRLPALAGSLAEVARRHEALRTRFVEAGGRPAQAIDAAGPVPLPVVDLGGLPAAAATAEQWRLGREEARRPFDLARGPLLRATVLRCGGECGEGGAPGARWWLLLDMHHIVSDGWSMKVLVREISAAYGERAGGAPAALPALRVQYADYARWQRDWLSGGVLAAELAYWRQRLAGAPPLLELPLDRPRPAVRSARGGSFELPLGPDAAAAAALGRRQGATLFMTLLAAFDALLWRWTGQADLSVGTPIAGRTQVETEPLIGFFVNTLVVRTRLAPGDGFAALLGQVKDAALGAYTHQELPFERLVEELAPERSLAHTPLFQALFAVQEDASEDLALPGLALRRVELDPAAAKFDWSLAVVTRGGGMAAALRYDAALFDPSTAARFARCYERLLAGIARSPQARLDDLSWLGKEERHQLVHEWSDTASAFPPATVHELFAEWARRAPRRPALEFLGETLSYGELEERANRLAHRLRALGMRPEARVGICVEPSAAMVVGFLAILKAGGAYVPLDPGYPLERLQRMVEDAGVELLVSEPERLGDLPEVATLVLFGEEEDEPATELASWSSPGSLAYVTYTSGSTGRPKGIAVPHEAVVRLVRGTDYVDLGPEDRVGQISNPTFDAATFEVWGALLCGGVLVGIPREVTLAPARFAASLREERVSALFLTTALFNQMARETPWAFGSLRYVLFGGEAVEPRWVEAVLAEGRPGRLLHVYGPTEATTFSTWHAVDGVEAGARTIPIGRPLANAQVYLLDAGRRLAPVGVAGELLLGGDGLARGYEGRPELTAASFVPDPWGGRPGGRLYRTGDLVRRDGAGRIEFLGRRDQQVKVRGFRIELTEIEAALAEHPAVAQAVVLARQVAKEGWSDRQLVAYVVACEGAPAGPELGRELRRHLADRLPSYMVPAQMVSLPALPLTATGKVDRLALAARPLGEAAEEAVERSAPRTPYEELVAQVWEELLGRERVGVDDDFFELGGHSLLATQVISRVSEAFQVELPLRVLFESTTVARLAAAVEKARHSASAPAAPPIERAPRTGGLPLSFAQERLWVFEQLEPGSSAYIMPISLRVHGRLEPAVLAATLGEIVRRHEVLRTRFVAVGGLPAQVIDAPAPLALPVVDLCALPAAARERESLRLVAAEAQRPFDLAADRLLRAALLLAGEEEAVVLLAMHHIASDGWSLRILVREVAALYAALREGRPSPLPELSVQYADYAAWQRRWLSGEVLAERLSFWRQRLGGTLPALDLRTDRPRGKVATYRGAVLTHRLARELQTGLRELSRRRGITLFMTLLAAFQTFLYRLTGADDVIVGSAVAGRDQLQTEDLIGFFINMLPLRADLAGNPPFSEVLQQVRETAIAAFDHQDVPIEKLSEELQPERQGGHPFFQVAFGLRNEGRQQLHLPGLELEALPVEHDRVRLDLSVWMSEDEEGMSGNWFYNTDLFDPATIERMQGGFAVLLASAVAQPEAPIKSLQIVGEDERRRQDERKASRFDAEAQRLTSGRRRGLTIGRTEP